MTIIRYLAAILTLVGLSMPVAAQVVPNPSMGDIEALRENAPVISATGSEPVSMDPAVMDRILLLLSGYEYFPTADDLLAETPTPEVYLLSLAYGSGDETLSIHRHRAIGAVAYFPSDLTRAHLQYMLDSPATPDMTRHHVITALARGFGDQAIPTIERFLLSGDLQLRLTAIAALGSVGSEAAGRALESSLPQQTHDLVRERIQQELLVAPPVDLR